MALSKFDFKKFIFFNVFASIIFISTIGLSAFYSSEAIISFFSVIKQNPWIAPLVLFSVIGLVWYTMEHMTKKR
jgi:membrane protein DedA with SNARE-associated domain